MLRLSEYAALVIGAAALGGCTNLSSENPNTNAAKMTDMAPTNTELAAYAGAHSYPTTQPSEHNRLAAIISSDHSSLHIYNFGGEPLTDVDAWINGAYVVHVRGIPANGSVIVKTADLYNTFGQSFASQSEPINKVQVRTDKGFYNALGPAAQ